jgi:hypothetical protein
LIGALDESVAAVVEPCLALTSGGPVYRLLVCARAAAARATGADLAGWAGRAQPDLGLLAGRAGHTRGLRGVGLRAARAGGAGDTVGADLIASAVVTKCRVRTEGTRFAKIAGVGRTVLRHGEQSWSCSSMYCTLLRVHLRV